MRINCIAHAQLAFGKGEVVSSILTGSTTSVGYLRGHIELNFATPILLSRNFTARPLQVLLQYLIDGLAFVELADASGDTTGFERVATAERVDEVVEIVFGRSLHISLLSNAGE